VVAVKNRSLNMKMRGIAVAVCSSTVIFGLVILYAWPKATTLGDDPSLQVPGFLATAYPAYYRGFGLSREPGILGRNYFRVRWWTTASEDGWTDVEFSGEGWNTFRGTYPDGTLREEGVCWVDLNGIYDEPWPDLHNVKTGRYYDPTGKLHSEIHNGTGRQTYWTRNGTRVWEMDLKDYKRVRVTMWHDNGQFSIEENYLDSKEHGRFASYNRAGQKTREGEYSHGKRVGKWTEYKPDGSIAEVTDYGNGKKIATRADDARALPGGTNVATEPSAGDGK
jgi:hypothetical protein